MPYTLRPTANAMAIAEREFGTANPEIRFGGFSSCIGLIGRSGNDVTGVHLSMMSPDDSYITIRAAQNAARMVNECQSIYVIGLTRTWKEDAASEVRTAYQEMVNILNSHTVKDTGDGIFGCRINAGQFQLFANNAYTNL